MERSGVTSPSVIQSGATEASHASVRVLNKVARRLIPFMCFLYLLAYLDRVNVSFANLQMTADLHLSDAVYGFAAGVFFVGYFLFEVPSNLILNRAGASRWIARIMISWGIVAMAMMFVRGKWSFYGLRLLLGMAEAGFFPGMVSAAISRTHDRTFLHVHRDRGDRGQPDLGGAAQSQRDRRIARVAMVVSAGRGAVGPGRGRVLFVPDGSADFGEMAR
jgi:sugar phosphate permease